MIGQTLSHYRIIAALGAGGMGEVYRATDTNLGRDVAIKVLPPEVRNDADRLARFRREARVLASLSHPNIASIYGLEDADGTPFLAMELVEGEDLQERLTRGAIPVDEALEIAEQIAEALEEAHARGVVHRDLKPANVKLTPDGKVKVLDFGLAKALTQDPGPGTQDLAGSPTITSPAMTQMGVILGTAAYMSPEQARGRPVDKRSDIWSFGVLVWEMLTGQSLFSGDTVTDVIAAVVTREPDLDALPASTPAAVRRLLERCLRKDPRHRLPDIGAARLELQDVRAGVGGDVGPAAVQPAGGVEGPSGQRRMPWVWAVPVLGLAAVAAILAIVHFGEARPVQPPTGRFVVDVPEGWALHSWGWPIVSPDGTELIFRAVPIGSADENASAVLWVRSLEAVGAWILPGTEGASHAFWSSDGGSVGFFRNEAIHRIDLATRTIRQVAAVTGTQWGGADWSDDGRILFSAGANSPDTLYVVPSAGGDPQEVDSMGPGGVFAGVAWLPGGDQFIAMIAGSEAPPGVYVGSVGDPDFRHQVLEGIMRVQYAQGRLFYLQGTALVAQPFDAGESVLTGEPVVVADPVGAWSQNTGIGWFGIARGGTLVYEVGQAESGDVQLTWMDRAGRTVGTLGAPGEYGQIALSPDERSVAIEVADPDGGHDLWVMDVARGVASRVTAGEADERNPVWSPDGRSLTFSAQVGNQADVRQKGLRATDPETIIVDTELADYPEAWVRGGRDLLFVRGASRDGNWMQGVWRVSPESGGEPEPFMDAGFYVDEPQVSPDGRWLAYNSQESGRSEVYVEPFERAGERVRVSVDGGGQAKWRGDGRELFFVGLDGRLMSVAVRAGDDRAGVDLPGELFEVGDIAGPDYDDYAPSADGQRFLVKVPLAPGQRRQMHVVTNWPSLVE